MNALFFVDREAKTELSENLQESIVGMLKDKGHNIELVELGKNDAAPCLGCLLCITKNAGECVTKDIVNKYKVKSHKYDMTIYLTPVLFGHFSSTIKNAIDRGTGSPNLQVIIGYGSDIYDEEKSTFIDLTAKHRGKADVVHPGIDRQVDVYLTVSAGDNSAICRKFTDYI